MGHRRCPACQGGQPFRAVRLVSPRPGTAQKRPSGGRRPCCPCSPGSGWRNVAHALNHQDDAAPQDLLPPRNCHIPCTGSEKRVEIRVIVGPVPAETCHPCRQSVRQTVGACWRKPRKRHTIDPEPSERFRKPVVRPARAATSGQNRAKGSPEGRTVFAVLASMETVSCLTRAMHLVARVHRTLQETFL